MSKDDAPDDAGVSRNRYPRYSNPRAKEYVREGFEESQKRVKVVRSKTFLTGTLTGDGTSEMTVEENLADFPAGNAYEVLTALADQFNVRLEEQ